jgi:lysozyme
MREINAAGLALIKSFEKCVLTAYSDEGGIMTIGYGHTGPEVCEGMVFTPVQAEMQLKKDLEKFYELDQYVSDCINDNQYSALICLAFNVGLRAVRLSQTLKLVNAGESPDIEWMGFCHVNGEISQGLVNRRSAELKLYHTLE